MKPLLPLNRILPFLLGLALGLPGGAQALIQSGDYYQALAPEGVHRDTCRELVQRLSDGHYAEIGFDDTLSSRIFDRYLMQLDPSRSYFQAGDIAEFEPYRHRFDDLLGDGDVEVAFAIYNRYQQRFAERLGYMLGEIEAGLGQIDFSVDETLQIDRKAAPWPEDQAALQDLWRRQLKNAVLGLKLTGKPLDAVADSLRKRYLSQLTRLRQSRNEDAFQSYMNALAYSFDPHTAYLSPRKSEDFSIDMNLSLEGIGAALQLEDEYTKVVRVIPGGPAQQSRQLNPADRIVAVGQGEDGEMVDIVGWRLDEVVRLIRGPKGTLVRLEIIPSDATDDHQTRTIHLRRDTVRLEDQAASKRLLEFQHEGRNFRIGVIRLPTFYVGTSRDVRKLVLELKGEGIDGLVVDLRNNGGGSLEEANTLTGEFIHRGPTVQIRNARGRVSVMSDPDDGIVYDGPLAVLVNGSSASASEIFAGAIQDYRRGLIIGSRTFGKGTVQTLRSLDHGKLKITQAKFYRVSGASTQHQGIVPDIHFPEVLDREQIGESALDGALPWDTIAPVNHQDYVPFDRYLDRLRDRHLARSATDTEFSILNAQIARQQELRERKTVSLNEAVRKREREEAREFELQLENRRRAARGESPLAELGENDEEQREAGRSPASADDPTAESLLGESSRILADLLLLTQPISASRN